MELLGHCGSFWVLKGRLGLSVDGGFGLQGTRTFKAFLGAIRNRNFDRYNPPYVDRIWLWVYYDKIPIYPMFYLPKGDYMLILGCC